jgi:drug/metabolite transporter (DMT)-like permease
MENSGDKRDGQISLDKKENVKLLKNDGAKVKEPEVKEVTKSQPSKSLWGITSAILSAFFLSLSNVFIKKTQLFSATEQTAIRYIIQAVIMLSVAIYLRLNIFGKKSDRKLLALRGIFGTIGLTTLHISVKLINPSDAVSLFHTNVIFVFILARILLKEKFNIIHILALVFAVTGVFLISQPSFLFKKESTLMNSSSSSLNVTSVNQSTSSSSFMYFLGVGIAMLGAFFSSAVAVLLKKLNDQKAHYSVAIAYAAYFGLPFTLLLSLLSYLFGIEKTNKLEHFKTAPALAWQIGFSLLSAFSGVLSQVLFNLALKYEEASKVSIIRSTDLFFIFILQVLLFHFKCCLFAVQIVTYILYFKLKFFILDIYSNLFSLIGAVLIFTASVLIMVYKLVEKKWNKQPRPGDDICCGNEQKEEMSIFRKILFFKM